ncbi:MAG: ImmA/IrrE family metallo-endopeptidase, partial [Candidatus Poribacteria bacterium]|nr:ImmA/IrrE family metallo-endopeptidase [Candidatus Poribacteria bacterium]
MDEQIPSERRNVTQMSSRTPQHPAECARQLLRELNVQAIPIQPREIAAQLQIAVWEREMESRYDGCLMRVGDAWGILLNSLIQSQSRKNFTTAHELGHYQLDQGKTVQYRCLREDLRAFDSHHLEERRANQFAVELLMPYPIFQADAVDLPEVGLPAIDTLAERYSTSLTSTAIRYTRLSQHVCAIVWSENRRIKYFAYSAGFRQNCDCYLEKDRPLHPASLAHLL